MEQQQFTKYDYIVIGAGPGGIATAKRAAQLKAKVLIIENKEIGGASLNWGSIPKKVMWFLSTHMLESSALQHYGLQQDQNLDFQKFKTKLEALTKNLHQEHMDELKQLGIDFVPGKATFISDKIVEAKGVQYSAEKICIASGFQPLKQSWEGYELCTDTIGFFKMTELPKTAVVLGCGFVAVELATILNGMGVRTTMVGRSTVLKSILDDEMRAALLNNMQKYGLDVKLNNPWKRVLQTQEGQLQVELNSGEVLECDTVFPMTQFPSTTDGMGLENTGIKLNESNDVYTNDYLETSVAGVYAVGNVNGKCGQTPVAQREGEIVAERLFNGKTSLKMDYDTPCVIFTYPPIGHVGMTETMALKKFTRENVKVFQTEVTDLFYKPISGDFVDIKSLFRIVCVKQGEDNGEDSSHLKVVGFQATGRGVDEMTQGVAIAIKMGATKKQFDDIVAIHPTASEQLVLQDVKLS